TEISDQREGIRRHCHSSEKNLKSINQSIQFISFHSIPFHSIHKTNTLTTLGCEGSRFIVCASAKKSATSCGVIPPCFITFTATSVFLYSPRYTTPKAPSPIFSFNTKSLYFNT